MRKFTIFIVIIALLTFAGTALALMGNSNTYTGCLNGGGNIIKVAIGDEPAGPCVDDQVQISWNAEGPQGPPGDPGLSKGYFTSKGNVDLILNLNDPPMDVMKLTLPAGDYISNITIHASPMGTHAFMDCFAEANSEPVTGDFGVTMHESLVSHALTFPIHLDSETEVVTSCSVLHVEGETEGVTIHRGEWSAIQVDTLIRQPPLHNEGN